MSELLRALLDDNFESDHERLARQAILDRDLPAIAFALGAEARLFDPQQPVRAPGEPRCNHVLLGQLDEAMRELLRDGEPS